ncbi:MAG: UPF0164 family protein [Candidatus Eisenbacteria bacterium]|uniref:UPF0164 family protein n=1 Tax=Eiseniibacteriota bacterium TaxID=2212470 RepID=A0A538TUR8_UNCEI|nr:MAG: UPF0164 family protein [Candidatus Eisenbacteria bacterium]
MSGPKERFMRRCRREPAVALTLLILALPGTALAAPGETGFAFLKLGVGARAMGLGSAYVALADDPTAIYWNPAGLAAISGTQVTAMHNEWIQDFRQEFVAVGGHLGPGALGVGMSGFYSSEFERRDDTGVLTGHYGFNDIAVTGAYGARVYEGLDAGVAVRYIREMIDQWDATAVTGDVGARYRLGETGVSFGAAVQNLGSDAKFISVTFPIPLTWRAGAAVSRQLPSLQGRGTLTTEIRKARDDKTHVHAGAEYSYRDRLALRVGGKFGYDDESVSFGLGLVKDWIHFDYALVPLSSDLGTTHFFSLTGVF